MYNEFGNLRRRSQACEEGIHSLCKRANFDAFQESLRSIRESHFHLSNKPRAGSRLTHLELLDTGMSEAVVATSARWPPVFNRWRTSKVHSVSEMILKTTGITTNSLNNTPGGCLCRRRSVTTIRWHKPVTRECSLCYTGNVIAHRPTSPHVASLRARRLEDT